MKIWMGFLLFSFLLGSRELRQGRATRTVLVLGMCVCAALALRTGKFV